MTRSRFEPPLSADDPRVSEWLDGRLPEAEAVEIARLVAASAELTRLVEDLRRQKAALAALPASPPPRGFVQDVLAALDAAGETAGDDAEVEEEWRRIERERLEEEIAEARADAAAPVDEPMRHRWPWLALAGALAAGVLATLVINRPGGPGDRDVALVEGRRLADRPAEQKKGGFAGRPAESARREADADAWLAEAAARDNKRDKQHQAESQQAQRQILAQPPAAPAAAAAAKPDALAGDRVAEEAGEKAELRAGVRTVRYRVRTAADRQRLEGLLAASRGEKRRARSLAAKELAPARAADMKARAAADERDRGGIGADSSRVPLKRAAQAGQNGLAGARIVISGPPGVIADLVAALGAGAEAGPEAESAAARKQDDRRVPGDPLAAGKRSARDGADGDLAADGTVATDQAAEAAQAADAAGEVMLVIEIVDESAAGPDEARP
jgi:hypothetical protein